MAAAATQGGDCAPSCGASSSSGGVGRRRIWRGPRSALTGSTRTVIGQPPLSRELLAHHLGVAMEPADAGTVGRSRGEIEHHPASRAIRVSISSVSSSSPSPGQRRDQHRAPSRGLPLGEIAAATRGPRSSSRSILFQTSINSPRLRRRRSRCRAGAAHLRRRGIGPRRRHARCRAHAGSRRLRSPPRAWRGRPRPAWSADRR